MLLISLPVGIFYGNFFRLKSCFGEESHIKSPDPELSFFFFVTFQGGFYKFALLDFGIIFEVKL